MTTATLTSLDALAASWRRSMRARNLSEATIRSNSEGVSQFIAYLAREAPEIVAAEQVRKSDLEGFLAEVFGKWSAATSRARHTGLAIFFKWAYLEGEIPRNPMDRIPPPKVPEQPVAVGARVLGPWWCSGCSISGRG